MKLDKRIPNFDLIFHPFDDYVAIGIGAKGYFTDDVTDFGNLNNCLFGELGDLNLDSNHPYKCNGRYFAFFIPEFNVDCACSFRAYTKDEFLAKYKVGDVIRYRRFEDNIEKISMFTRFELCSDDVLIDFDRFTLNLEDMFCSFEVFENNEWKPFGVKDES